MLKVANDQPRQLRRRIAPLGTWGKAEEVATTAVCLANHESTWITGALPPVDARVMTARAEQHTEQHRRRLREPVRDSAGRMMRDTTTKVFSKTGQLDAEFRTDACRGHGRYRQLDP